jgi:F-type H+-transporting ATPase subunit b
MIVSIRASFGLNTNLFETNVFNLAVVLGIVVTVVGDAFSNLLDQRRRIILRTLKETDEKVIDAQKRLEKSRKAVEVSRLRARSIRAQANRMADLENSIVRQQLKDDLARLQEKSRQTLQYERQRKIQSIVKNIADASLASAENILLEILWTQGQGRVSSRQKKLNEIHVRETLCQFK